MDINGTCIYVLWVTCEITCLYWVQRMPQTTAPQAWRWWPLRHSSESSLSLYEEKFFWNKKAKQLHGCIWSCVASFYSKSSLCLSVVIFWPNWPCSPCCHSVSKTVYVFGLWLFLAGVSRALNQQHSCLLLQASCFGQQALEVPWCHWKWEGDDGPSGSLFCILTVTGCCSLAFKVAIVRELCEIWSKRVGCSEWKLFPFLG